MLQHLNSLTGNKKIYFASDFHLGAQGKHTTNEREQKIVKWLDTIARDAHAIFLLGDIFDFWFEYKRVIPKGFVRLQGKLAQIRDHDIPVFIFTGNHDMWMFDYFPEEFNIPVFHEPQSFEINNHKLYIGHGDGLGPGDKTYKLIKKVFRNRISQWLFRWMHPDLGIKLAHKWSRKSRLHNEGTSDEFIENDEWLLAYCHDMEKRTHHDFYIFGHRHLPIDVKINESSRYINLGEWVNHYSYGAYDGSNMQLITYED